MLLLPLLLRCRIAWQLFGTHLSGLSAGLLAVRLLALPMLGQQPPQQLISKQFSPTRLCWRRFAAVRARARRSFASEPDLFLGLLRRIGQVRAPPQCAEIETCTVQHSDKLLALPNARAHELATGTITINEPSGSSSSALVEPSQGQLSAGILFVGQCAFCGRPAAAKAA